MTEILIASLFFLIAFLYSTVGFGGGSSYLALLSVIIADFADIRTMALCLNITVVLIGSYRFSQLGLLPIKLFFPFVATSVIAAFIGTQVRLEESMFFVVLGFTLILASGFMMIQNVISEREDRKLSVVDRSGIGAAIGFLAGLVGIGGGIFLSPTLHFIRWKNARTVAALSSFFILCNSTAGLIGLSMSKNLSINAQLMVYILPAVAIGGLTGNLLLTTRLNKKLIRGLTSLFVGYVGLRLVLSHWLGIQI